MARGGLHVQGELNGHALTAIVDCGASYSLFDSDFVTKVAGAGLMGTGRIYSRGVDGHNIMTYFFVPRQLSFGSINFEREQIGCGQADTLGRDKVQALLGYDLLAEHKAIIDLGHDVLWMQ
ncbi:MAG: aspartyl protease family protein [Verrucomicrobiota bacterium]